MSSTLTQKPDDEQVSTTKREPPLIKPASVTIHSAGQCFKTVVVTAPPGLVPQDLHDTPTVWRLVQNDKSGKALSEFDALEIRWPDKMVTARVNHADWNQVILCDLRITAKPQRTVALYKDSRFEVRWAAEGGYTYYRLSDGVRMSGMNWPTPESCKAEMMRIEYPPSQSQGVIG